MHIIANENYSYYFDPHCNPAAKINSGDSVWFETMDCFSDTLISENTQLGKETPRESNPITGPLYIIDAEAGDTLKIHINEITVGEIAITGSGMGLKCFKNLNGFQLRRMKINDSLIEINDKIQLPIEPMIGTIGVSPKEKVLSVFAGDYGGNMDCKLVKKGAYVYLPVFVDGALLSIGDLHALMGDGEVCECGAETNGKVKLTVELLKHTKRTNPVIEFENKWITVAAKKNADEAITAATEYMYKELVEKLNIDYNESALLLTLLGNVSICASNDYYTVARMEFPMNVMKIYNFIKS